jgi:hypothetical protein
MRVIENGIEREATEEEIALEKRIREEDSKLFLTEPDPEPFDELLDELENITSVKDIKNVAKKMREKRGGKR